MNQNYMSLVDWLILVIPVTFVVSMGFYSRKYIRGVSDYLACGRVCGRYVLNMGDVANALSIIGLVAYIEMKYKTGFALNFWGSIIAPLTLVISLSGYVTYRFRQTRAMSVGQFLEIRYNRKIRIFAAGLRSLAEMLANMIMPSIAARFFIQMLNLPQHISFLGISLPTFDLLMIFFLTLAITLICLGGTLALVITDTLQGMLLYPLLISFIVFILMKFSWSQEIIPTVCDRVPGESFINPMDISKLRDFNVFTMVIVAGFNCVVHLGTWIGAGTTTAAKSAHEQKMAAILGNWRMALINTFYMLVALCLIVFLNHKDFADGASAVRHQLASRVAEDVLKGEENQELRSRLQETIQAIPPQVHEINKDPKLSQKDNLDTRFLENIQTFLVEDAVTKTEAAARRSLEQRQAQGALSPEQLEAAEKATSVQVEEAKGKANDTFQQFRTLFTQLNLSVTMRNLLPKGLFGAFCLLLFLAMLSTDDSRIFSATLTIAQDCILPFFPKGLTPKQHVRMIRLVAIGIGVFFFFGSKYMSQLDYIQLFNQMAVAIWNAGCPAVMILGLYWKKGTSSAAWTSLITGIVGSVCYILLSRYWADVVYPFLVNHDMVASVDNLFRGLSAPFGDWIHWEINELRFPVNSIEYLFFANIFTILLYIVVSLLTCKEDFNMDRMLHRGKYAPEGEPAPAPFKWTVPNMLRRVVGITSEYTTGDKVIAYALFFHSFVFSFLCCFVGVAIWNKFSPWPVEWWSRYFLVVNFGVPLCIAAITTVWFSIGGVRDLFRLFHDLENRKNVNSLDDGRVEGNVSLADQAEVAKDDQAKG
ncbi:MAG: sodium:solute symporter [Oligosphaeraceae bacterium]